MKSFEHREQATHYHVALLVSAWIEIFVETRQGRKKIVALLVSAWIEIDDVTKLATPTSGSHSL